MPLLFIPGLITFVFIGSIILLLYRLFPVTHRHKNHSKPNKV